MFNIESSQISRLDSYGKYMFLAARRSPGILPSVLNAGENAGAFASYAPPKRNTSRASSRLSHRPRPQHWAEPFGRHQ